MNQVHLDLIAHLQWVILSYKVTAQRMHLRQRNQQRLPIHHNLPCIHLVPQCELCFNHNGLFINHLLHSQFQFLVVLFCNLKQKSEPCFKGSD